MELTQTIQLDYCWVCKSVDTLHEHHVIPRAFGGTDGPTVTVCSTCHGALHRAAVSKNFSTDPQLAVLNCTNLDNTYVPRLTRLATIVFNSGKLVQSDPNKMLTFQTKFEAEYARMLRTICERENVSQQNAVRLALRHYIKTGWNKATQN